MNKFYYSRYLLTIIKENATEKDFLNVGFKIDDSDEEKFYILDVYSKKHNCIGGTPLHLGTFFREVDTSKNCIWLNQNYSFSKDEWELFQEIFQKWEEQGFLKEYDYQDL